MTMRPFHLLFPELADQECRTVRPMNHERLPSRRFLFLEAYCAEPRCNCRRVMLSVIDEGTRAVAATINHAFEPPGPPHEDEPQTFLDPLNPQSDLADDLLLQFQSMIDHDRAYQARLERHYLAWKAVVDDPAHPRPPDGAERAPRRPGLQTRVPGAGSLSPAGAKDGTERPLPLR